MKDLATIHAAGIAAAIKTTTASETFLGAMRAAAKHLKTAAAVERLETAGPQDGHSAARTNGVPAADVDTTSDEH